MDNYPETLAQIKGAPQKLYCRGDVNLLNTMCVAVVGTRKPSKYGLWVAESLGRLLAENGVTAVSGFALGIDSSVHRAALAAGGKTIAVLGCGLDVVYPAGNRALRTEMAQKGLLMTEYDKNFKGSKYSFPCRNRIISGISQAVVVVEAGCNSGALITASHGGEQGKLVYGIPGNINSPGSMGVNMLIRDGAMPLAVLPDILSDLGIENVTRKDYGVLGEEEIRLCCILEKRGEITWQMAAEAMRIPLGRMSGIITVLEMKGVVYTAMGKIFLAKS